MAIEPTTAAAAFHRQFPTVYYGGVILIAVICLFGYLRIDDVRLRVGLLGAGLLTLVVGTIDEQRRLSPAWQFVCQVGIALFAVAWGWNITAITHPWQTGVLALGWYQWGVFMLPGSILAVIWLLLLMNAVNWLDGVDGLASGVGTVSFFTLAAVSLLPSVQDADTFTLALIGGGATLGFLLWNFSPARVYLGTSGSWFLGLYVGMIAIVGGGKIVTTLLVLALPVVDVAFVLLGRLWARKAPWRGDTTRHLHYRLLNAGAHPRFIALFGMAVSIVLGLAAILLQTEQKIVAMLAAAAMLVAVLVGLMYKKAQNG